MLWYYFRTSLLGPGRVVFLNTARLCRKEMADCSHMSTVNFLAELCIHSQTCSHIAKRLYLLSVTMNCQHNRALNLTNFDSAHMFHDHCTKRRWLETVRSTMHNMGHITRHCAKGRGRLQSPSIPQGAEWPEGVYQ